MVNKNNKKNNVKYMSDFPIIIVVVFLIIIVALSIMYFSIKPYKTIHKDGYMAISNNMTYNLITNNVFDLEKLNVDVVPIATGDYIYKRMDSYYVGLEKKQEIDYSYPLYSPDGLTIYNFNENVVLIDKNFQMLKGYYGFYLTNGILYNDGDPLPADVVDYLFLQLDNSIYINAQVIVIETETNEYTIPIHSPIYFNSKYINYYTFDAENFKYNKITDVYSDSLVKIGDITLTYGEFFSQMGLVNVDDIIIDGDNFENKDENDVIIEDNKPEEEKNYKKPTVNVSEFTSGVYSLNTELFIDDPSGVIISNPMFEIYIESDKLYSRKRFNSSGNISIGGLSANTEYIIVGTYKYKNENGVSIVNNFYEGKISTKGIEFLDEIQIESELGDIYSNKIEIKNLNIINKEAEAVSAISKIELIVFEEGDENQTKKVDLSYSQIRHLINGEKITITSQNNLKSNTVYEYMLKFYDKDNNQLRCSGNISGLIKTSKSEPNIKISSNIDKKQNIVNLNIETRNSDNIYIKDYKYELYSYSGFLVSEGNLNYEDKNVSKLSFSDLDYNTNYILKVTGIYDLEDGQGERKLNIKNDFTTAKLDSNFVAWYDEKTLEVTNDSIKADVYIGINTVVLEKDTTEVVVYLADSDGNEILDENGNLKYFNKYTKDEYANLGGSSYHVNSLFEGLDSNTKYNIKVKIIVKQLEKFIELDKMLSPTITTKVKEAYINVINKKLIGNSLDVLLEVIDPDKLISQNGVIVEIYEGKYSDPSEITGRYIYRNIYDISKTNRISLNFQDYTADNYTILVSSDPYNGIDIKKYLYISDGLSNSSVINIDKQIDARIELYEQKKDTENSKNYNTKIGIKYNLYNTKTNVYLVDCISDGNCDVLGYIDSKKDIHFTNDRIKEPSEEEIKKNIITISNPINSGEHNFYLIIEKGEANLLETTTFKESLISENLYILSSLNYTTAHEIYNIKSAADFFDTKLIKKSNENRHYVVTDNIDFNEKNKITTAYFSGFNGSIDFQGYSVELYKDNKSIFTLFNTTGKNSVIKNVVLNYHLDYEGVITTAPGFINNNYGHLENIIVTVNQKYKSGSASNMGLLSYANYGTINKFVAYLNSDVITYGSTSSLLVLENKASGIISNGYVATNPSVSTSKKIIMRDSLNFHGTFAYTNYGLIKNVYNLVDVISEQNVIDNKINAKIATIVNNNNIGAVVQNTISIAATTQHVEEKFGPNIYTNRATSTNNYYIDTNINNVAFVSNYTKRIDRATLINKSSWETILNSDNAFLVTLGYYPIVKMDNFMKDKQAMIGLTFDYYSESKIDVISSDVLYNNANEEATAKVKIYISNPNKHEITNIRVDSLNSEIESINYDESTQTSVAILKLSLGETSVAKSGYIIKSVTYKDDLGGQHIKSYNENNQRTLDLEMYRCISLYDDLVKYINSDENIYFVENIKVSGDPLNLPNFRNYSAILDGNEKTLDFNNKKITRGFYIYKNIGTIKNLQIKNLNIVYHSNNHAGFIMASENGILNNINIVDSVIEIRENSSSSNLLFLGGLVGYSKKDIINNVSINNLEIKKSDNYNGEKFINYVGGIVGYGQNSQIYNSYAYNLNIKNMFTDSSSKEMGIGGIVGYIQDNTTVENCYSTGNINVDYSGVGGIVGVSEASSVKNNYSYMSISSSGNNVGGIVGNFTSTNAAIYSVINNMFIGRLINRNGRDDYSLISATTVASNNYALIEETKFTKVKKIIDTNNLTEFDLNNSFMSDKNSEDLPYLESTSFVNQQIKNQNFVELGSDELKYELFYVENVENKCSTNNQITSVNEINSYVDKSDLYNNACADYAELMFVDVNGNPISNYEIISSEENTLQFEKIEGRSVYKLMPNNYLNYYTIKVKNVDTNIEELVVLDLKFYKKISNQYDWNIVSNTRTENMILLNDIELNSDVGTSKNINVLLGNGYEISFVENLNLKDYLINKIDSKMVDVNFVGSDKAPLNISNETMVGLIKNNEGSIKNCSFENIIISSSKNYSAIIVESPGYISNVKLNKINVSGVNYVASLVAQDNSKNNDQIHISEVKANAITINGRNYVGGIVGDSNNKISDIEVTNLKIGDQNNSSIYPKTRIGGIIGDGDCVNNCIVTNGTIYASGSYIGGITGAQLKQIYRKNLKVEGLLISDNIKGVSTQSNYVGGICGNCYYYRQNQVKDLIIGKIKEVNGENTIANFNGSYIGGLGGSSVAADNSKVDDSFISGNNLVGGIFGNGWNGTIYNNAVVNSTISASGDNSGGIIGAFRSGNATAYLRYNIVMNSNITANQFSGGIIGYLNNETIPSQNMPFSGNLAIGLNVSSNEIESAGGIIGKLKQVPSSSIINFNTSLFYGNVSSNSLVGNIENKDTGISSGYGEILNIDDFVIKSNFKEYIDNANLEKDYQINSVNDLKTFISGSAFKFVDLNDGKNYFPVFSSSSYPTIDKDDYIEIPYDSGTGYQSNTMMFSFRNARSFSNYSSSYNNKINIDYDVYASDVDKINIEFSDIDSETYFYYEIGNYTSEHVQINNRTYTLTYDFKNPIKIYVTNGYNNKESFVNPNDLAKTISLVDKETYYINNDSLYSESKMIVGEFKNLYENKVLTSDGKIYDIITKKEYNANIDYKILRDSKPIYEFIYEGNIINTYYNYSVVNNTIKEFQFFVKNGNLNSMSASLGNKKDMYIIDYYNNNEFQIILKEDGKLYSIKNNIKYPKDIINEEITELYTNINSTTNIVVVKYENGSIYTFDYRTGDLLFTNVSDEYASFLDYIKKKISESSKYSTIENIKGYDNYSEIELLKSKIYDVSIDEANDKINNTNSALKDNDNYITVYNEVTENYDVYKISSLLDNSIEIESETDKLYNDYELIQFYKTLGNNKKKSSVSGIILFAISIIAVLSTLILLIRNRKNKKGDVL